jgi:hypothetical protein
MDKRISPGEDWRIAESITTTGVFHKRPECYLAEIIMINKHGKDLPSYFWNKDKYKKAYISYLQMIKKRLVYCEFSIINSVILKNNVTKLDASFDTMVLKFLKESHES